MGAVFLPGRKGRQIISALRIGILTSDLSYGHGWGHYGLGLLRALARAGVELVVAAAAHSPPVDGLAVHALLPDIAPAQRFLVPRMALAAPRVRALFAGCDLVHAAAEPYAPLAAWVAGGRPLFVTVHGTYAYIDRFHRWPASALYRRALRAARLVCVSQYTAGVARAHLNVAPEQTPVVNNGIDPERFAHLPPPPEPKRGPTVLSAGGVKARKGTLELVRALAVVRRQIPDAQCVVLGSHSAEPAYVERVRDAVRDLGLEDCVHLPGFVEEATLLGWYGAADLFVMPSINSGRRFEGFGLVHLEASAAGLPVIGTAGCGVEDAIDDGVTGLLLAQDSLAETLPAAIVSILSDPARGRAMGAAGQLKARAQTWDKAAAEMLALYHGAPHPRSADGQAGRAGSG